MTDDLLARIKASLEACKGMWILPDDADDLAEVCEAAVRRALGREWHRPAGPVVEYEVTSNDAES